MVPSTVRDGLKTRLATITGLRSYDLIPDVVTPPCAIVAQLDVYVIVQRFSERAGQDKLDAYLSGSGASSIKTALEGDRTLGGAINTLRVTGAEAGTYESQGVQFISYRYRLTLWG